MDRYKLPTSIKICDKECEINADYRNILEIFKILNDPNLLESEKIIVSLQFFYKTKDYLEDTNSAIKNMFDFIVAGDIEDSSSKKNEKPLFDWEQDFNLIIAPINKSMSADVRGFEFLHWWTFLSAFMEIGECTFNTIIGIRDKLNRGIKLEKHEEKILKDNREKVILKPKYDDTTQALMNEIMGKG